MALSCLHGLSLFLHYLSLRRPRGNRIRRSPRPFPLPPFPFLRRRPFGKTPPPLPPSSFPLFLLPCLALSELRPLRCSRSYVHTHHCSTADRKERASFSPPSYSGPAAPLLPTLLGLSFTKQRRRAMVWGEGERERERTQRLITPAQAAGTASTAACYQLFFQCEVEKCVYDFDLGYSNWVCEEAQLKIITKSARLWCGYNGTLSLSPGRGFESCRCVRGKGGLDNDARRGSAVLYWLETECC